MEWLRRIWLHGKSEVYEVEPDEDEVIWLGAFRVGRLRLIEWCTERTRQEWREQAERIDSLPASSSACDFDEEIREAIREVRRRKEWVRQTGPIEDGCEWSLEIVWQ